MFAPAKTGKTIKEYNLLAGFIFFKKKLKKVIVDKKKGFIFAPAQQGNALSKDTKFINILN